MSFTCGQDVLLLSNSLENIPGTRRRTISTSFEHGRDEDNSRSFQEGRQTKSFAQDMSSLLVKLHKNPSVLSSIREDEICDGSFGTKLENSNYISENQPESKSSWLKSLKYFSGFGIILCFFNVFMFQVGNVVVKEISAHIFVILLFRTFNILTMYVPFITYTQRKIIDRRTILFLCFNGMLNMFSTAMHYYVVTILPLGDTVMISAIKPAFINLFSWMFLKEKCGIIEIVNLLLVSRYV